VLGYAFGPFDRMGRRTMAAVEVWVDDAVRGDLPGVCVKTGAPADGLVRVVEEKGSLGLAWLLVFFGPIGWLVLLVLLATNRRELFTVRLPYSHGAWERERRLGRQRVVGVLLSALLFVAALLGVAPFSRLTWTIATLVAAIATIVVAFVVQFSEVRVDLDASRRWVSLGRVHPAFADAVARRDRDRQRASHVS
jgi:hypothetical protein